MSTALVSALKSVNSLMVQLYENMKADCKQPPTIEELQLAANLPPFNTHKAAVLVTNLKPRLKVTLLNVLVSNNLALGPAAVVSLCGSVLDS